MTGTTTVATSGIGSFFAAHPEILAILLAVLGLLAARTVQAVTRRLLSRLDRRLVETGSAPLSERAVRVLVSLAFWSVAFATVLLVLRTLGAGYVSASLDAALAWLPGVLVGALIIAVGHVLGVAARNLILAMRGDPDTARPLSRLVQGAIFLLGVVTGVQQMGLDVSFVADLIVLVVGVTLAGLSLAFALGARQHVANLVARSTIDRYVPGDLLRIDDVEGVVVEVHRTGVDLRTGEGIVTVPASRFAETVVLRRRADDEASS